MQISEEFPGAHYVPFTPGERILDRLAEPVNLEWMRELTGADFWGLYVKKSCGAMKKALYNVHGFLPRSPEAEAQQAYRDALWADFSVATNEVAVGETLVLNMFGQEGWSVEATRQEATWTFEFKHSPGYGRALYRGGCDDRGAYEFTISGQGLRPAEAFTGPVEINLLDCDFFAIKGEINKLPWTPLPEQVLRIHRTDGSLVQVKAEPTAPGDLSGQKYRYYAWEFESADSSGAYETHLQMDEATWDSLIDFLQIHGNRIPME